MDTALSKKQHPHIFPQQDKCSFMMWLEYFQMRANQENGHVTFAVNVPDRSGGTELFSRSIVKLFNVMRAMRMVH